MTGLWKGIHDQVYLELKNHIVRQVWGTCPMSCTCVCVCVCVHDNSFQTLCNPMDHNLPGSSVHGILQARILEWVVISFSRGSSPPRNQSRVSDISCMGRQVLPLLSQLGSPISHTILLLLFLLQFKNYLKRSATSTRTVEW